MDPLVQWSCSLLWVSGEWLCKGVCHSLTTGRLASLCRSAYFNIGVGNPVASPFFRPPHTPANRLCTIVYLTLNTTGASHSVILALYVLGLVLINEVRCAAMRTVHRSIILGSTTGHPFPPRPNGTLSRVFLLFQTNNCILAVEIHVCIVWNGITVVGVFVPGWM